MIGFGDADVMIAGGAEAAVCRLGIAGFAAARALSSNFNEEPTRASRPWDEDRDGFVMGEGAGVVILEEYEHAKARGAKIYAEVAGYGMSGDAYHITSPPEDGSGGYRAMQAALRNAGMNLEDVDYINAHGTSTPVGDEIELGAVKRLFGDHAYKPVDVVNKIGDRTFAGSGRCGRSNFLRQGYRNRCGTADAKPRKSI